MQLFPFQKQAVDKLEKVKAVLIGDDTTPGPLYGIQIELFLKKISLNEGTGCWTWTAALGGSGMYGTYAWRYHLNGPRKSQRPAHVIMYMIWHGLVPTGLMLDHTCRVHECVSPYDLEAVTAKENQRRGLNGVLKTHCASGHDFVGENIYVDPRGWRECRICRYDAVVRHRAKEVM